MNAGIRPEHLGFEQLPVPVAIGRGEGLVYVNPALAQLLGTERSALLAMRTPDLLARFVNDADQGWVDPLRPPSWRGNVPGATWARLMTREGERTFLIQPAPGPCEGERLYMLLDGEGEAAARRLTEALAQAAGELFRHREDWDVLDAAVDVIHRQGFTAAVILLEGDELVHGPLRQNPEGLAAAERLYGMPMQQVRFRRNTVPHIEECIATRRSAFYLDVAKALERFHTPEVLALIRQLYPGGRGLDAPIFVGGQPFGILAVQGPTLTPASAATIELFARQVGSALDNVRHHRALAEQLAQLARMQAELVARERLAAVGEAAAVVAHEIRNPIGAILNGVALLKREGEPGAGPPVLQMLEEEAQHLDFMVSDLLDYTRSLEPRVRPVVLAEVARRTAALVHSRGELGTVRLEVSEEGAPGTVEADPDLLQLALLNLVRNAVQASPPSGLVHIRAVAGPGGASLVVEDQGEGIAARDAGKIFEPFFTTRARGSGLGLAVVTRVAIAHHGEVRVGRSAAGGARFELALGSR